MVALKPAPSSLKDPIQLSVIDFVSKSKNPSSVEDIRKHAEPATEPVRDALRASGLLLNERALWTGGLAIGTGGLTASILLLSAAGGGISPNSVFWGLVVTLIATLYLIRRRRRTQRGNAVLKRLQEDHVALKATTEHAPALLTPRNVICVLSVSVMVVFPPALTALCCATSAAPAP